MHENRRHFLLLYILIFMDLLVFRHSSTFSFLRHLTEESMILCVLDLLTMGFDTHSVFLIMHCLIYLI